MVEKLGSSLQKHVVLPLPILQDRKNNLHIVLRDGDNPVVVVVDVLEYLVRNILESPQGHQRYPLPVLVLREKVLVLSGHPARLHHYVLFDVRGLRVLRGVLDLVDRRRNRTRQLKPVRRDTLDLLRLENDLLRSEVRQNTQLLLHVPPQLLPEILLDHQLLRRVLPRQEKQNLHRPQDRARHPRGPENTF